MGIKPREIVKTKPMEATMKKEEKKSQPQPPTELEATYALLDKVLSFTQNSFESRAKLGGAISNLEVSAFKGTLIGWMQQHNQAFPPKDQ